MNSESLQNNFIPSEWVRIQEEKNIQLKQKLSTMQKIEIEWLFSFLKSFISRIIGICDSTVLYFLENKESTNCEEKTIMFFLDNAGLEFEEINSIYWTLPLSRLNTEYKHWIRRGDYGDNKSRPNT